MPQIIATYRPFKFTKGICYINSGTRNKQQAPFDHIAYCQNGWVFESVIKHGAHHIKFDEWVKGREGTHLFIYDVPYGLFDQHIFWKLKNTAYDTPSNIYHLFGLINLLPLNGSRKNNCAEILARMMLHPNPDEMTPRKLVEIMDAAKYPLTHKII